MISNPHPLVFEAEEDLIVIITEEEMAVLSPQAKEADLLPIKKQNFDRSNRVFQPSSSDSAASSSASLRGPKTGRLNRQI